MENIPETEPLMNKKNAIYRRPLNVRGKQDSNFLYTPRIVSFGPYHHHDECCRQTNKIKELALLPCLKNSVKGKVDYVDSLIEDVKNLKEAYNKLEQKWEQDDDAFLRLMIFDGCFLLHILREGNRLGHLSHQVLAAYEISPRELIEYYKHDMLLLENQLPLQLLEKLFALQNDLPITKAQEGLYKLVLSFIAPSSPNIPKILPREMGYRHVLDLYRHSLLYHDQHGGRRTFRTAKEAGMALFSSLENFVATNGACFSIMFFIFLLIGLLAMFQILIIVILTLFSVLAVRCYIYLTLKSIIVVGDIYFIIPSATELNKVGIVLCANKTKSLEDISFEGETLSLPQINVDVATKSTLLNIIAFEQLDADAENVVTSYIYFISKLLQAASDVRLLQLTDIIWTTLNNDEAVELFQSLTKDIIVRDPNIFLVSHYLDAGRRLSKSFYYKMNNPWERGFWQTFTSQNPWASISIVGAIYLFGLTAIQTVFTVLSYYSK